MARLIKCDVCGDEIVPGDTYLQLDINEYGKPPISQEFHATIQACRVGAAYLPNTVSGSVTIQLKAA